MPKKNEENMKVKVGITEKITKTLFRRIKLNKSKVQKLLKSWNLHLYKLMCTRNCHEVCEKINENY